MISGIAGNGMNLKTATMVIYMTDVEEVCYTEVPEYTREDFLSDIGGSAGLILGMSVATVIGFLDIVIQSFVKYLKNLIKNLYSILLSPTGFDLIYQLPFCLNLS